jgi:hypothetical protein
MNDDGSARLHVELRRRPLEIFLAWLASLGPCMADDLMSSMMAIAPPGLAADDRPQTRDARAFEQSIHSLADSPRAEVGTTLMLTSLVDFVFRRRSSAEDWRELMDLEEQMAAMQDDGLAARARDEVRLLPLRAKRWMRAARSWSALRRGLLSVEAIEDYLDERPAL